MNIILQGLEVTGKDDPMIRLSGQLITFNCLNCIFVNPTVSTYLPNRFSTVSGFRPDWTNFFTRPLSALTIQSSNMVGLLPTSIPSSLTQLKLPHNSFSGSIPVTILNGITASAMSVDLSDNLLSGSLTSLMSGDFPNLSSLFLILSQNTLSGTLPANLFNGVTTPSLKSFQLSVSQNSLEGTFPTSFFGSAISGKLTSLTATFALNRLSGTLSSSFFSTYNMSAISTFVLDLSSNQFSGSFDPAASVLSWTFTQGTALSTLSLNLNNNTLNGSLPSSLLPSGVSVPDTIKITIDASLNNLSGTLPQSLLSNIPSATTLVFRAASNRLEGEIPSNWFSGMPMTKLTSFTLSFSNNTLSGSPFGALFTIPTGNILAAYSLNLAQNQFLAEIPNNFCENCQLTTAATARIAVINLAGNRIYGSVPDSLLVYPANYFSTFSFHFGGNQLTGTIPATLFAPMSSTSVSSSQILNFTSNMISGILPSSWFYQTTFPDGTSISLDFSSNSLASSLNPNFFTGIPTSITGFTLYLDNNPMGGTIPTDFLTPLVTPTSVAPRTNTISMINCSFTGAMPTDVLGDVNVMKLNVDKNKLSGIFPLEDILASGTHVSIPSTYTISATDNSFDGELVVPDGAASTALVYAPIVNVLLDNNQLTKLTISPTAYYYLSSLGVSNNVQLTGTLPSSLFGSTSILNNMNAANTSLNGLIADLGSSSPSLLYSLILSGSKIDFCSGARKVFVPFSLSSCSLDSTTANTCEGYYPSMCFSGNSVSNCSLSTRPSPQFICVNGIWTTSTPVTVPTLVIPSGSTQTVVNADVESSVVIFNGLGSLTISGCANNLSEIIVTLTAEELKGIKSSKITQLLVSYANNDNNCTDLSAVTVSLDVKGSSCRKAKVTKSTSSGQLSGLFTIDSSSCNTWWIILVSVICGVVLILVIVFVLLMIFVPSFRTFIRPFSNKRKGPSAGNVA